ncbi:alpha/beta fold hydrolase [Ureaplasma ceti]|uniref:Alpha/beta hydrolase n=1 Tax=Ureaplasma ceti TaxID=3119530 RepID=A0ABP9U8W6_9BACT
MFTTQFQLSPDDLQEQSDIFYIKAKSEHPKGTILFIHGFTSSYLLHHWFILNNVFEDYNYLALNLIGHEFNRQEEYKTLKEVDLYTYVRQLESYIETHHIYNLILIGHSMGGGVAMLLYDKMKNRINKIILVDAINPAIYHSKLGPNYLLQTLLNHSKKLISFQFLKHHPQKSVEYDLSEDYINYEVKRFLDNKNNYLALGTKLIEPKLQAELHRIYKNINIPVLYIMGESDRIIPYKQTKKYIQKLDNKSILFRTINNAAHVPFIDNFDQYNEYVWWFIKKSY